MRRTIKYLPVAGLLLFLLLSACSAIPTDAVARPTSSMEPLELTVEIKHICLRGQLELFARCSNNLMITSTGHEAFVAVSADGIQNSSEGVVHINRVKNETVTVLANEHACEIPWSEEDVTTTVVCE